MDLVKPDCVQNIVWDQLDNIGKSSLISSINNNKYLPNKLCNNTDNKYMIIDKDIWKQKIHTKKNIYLLIDELLDFIWDIEPNNKFNHWTLDELDKTNKYENIIIDFKNSPISNYLCESNFTFNYKDYLNGYYDFSSCLGRLHTLGKNSSYDLGYDMGIYKNNNLNGIKKLNNISGLSTLKTLYKPLNSLYLNN